MKAWEEFEQFVDGGGLGRYLGSCWEVARRTLRVLWMVLEVLLLCHQKVCKLVLCMGDS